MSPTIETENGTKPFNIPCGCGSRKEIMGAGEWQRDAITIGIILAIPIAILIYKKVSE